MKKTFLGLKAIYFYVLIGLLLIGIIVGSFLDQSISASFYNKDSGYGAFFETIGLGLGYGMGPIAGVVCLFGLIHRKKWWQKALGFFLFLLGYLAPAYVFGRSLVDKPTHYGILFSAPLAYILGFTIMALFAILTFLILDKRVEKQDTLPFVGLALTIAMLGQTAFIYVVKYLGGRPRWRYINDPAINTTGDVFRAWWQMQPFKVNGDYLKSWPSGHSAVSAVTLTLGLLPLVSKRRFKFDQDILLLLGFAYMVFTMVARIRYGAHYLTDVCFGALFSILICLGGCIYMETYMRKYVYSKPTESPQA